ncbi:hypothetical protein PR048_029495 [Dryococelus australis]|uniref:Uncharacterized protein n=1 Tax=Dryococelus australis TaxID=614101 RepID=A0ABQ9GDJ0_9NEOP|nr:hypothetical protein PR048_029495 [Dryococelus australis]
MSSSLAQYLLYTLGCVEDGDYYKILANSLKSCTPPPEGMKCYHVGQVSSQSFPRPPDDVSLSGSASVEGKVEVGHSPPAPSAGESAPKLGNYPLERGLDLVAPLKTTRNIASSNSLALAVSKPGSRSSVDVDDAPARVVNCRVRGCTCVEPIASSFQDKIDVKHVYTEVDFAIGSQFIRHALDDSEPIADLQGNKSHIGTFRCWPIALTASAAKEGRRLVGVEGKGRCLHLITGDPVTILCGSARPLPGTGRKDCGTPWEAATGARGIRVGWPPTSTRDRGRVHHVCSRSTRGSMSRDSPLRPTVWLPKPAVFFRNVHSPTGHFPNSLGSGYGAAPDWKGGGNGRSLGKPADPECPGPRIEPGSPWWEASRLTAQPPWPQRSRLRFRLQIWASGDENDRGSENFLMKPSSPPGRRRSYRCSHFTQCDRKGWFSLGAESQNVARSECRRAAAAGLNYRRSPPINYANEPAVESTCPTSRWWAATVTKEFMVPGRHSAEERPRTRSCNSHVTCGVVVRLFASHHGEPGSIPGGVTPRFPHSGIVSARFLGDLPFPPPLHSGAAPYSPRFTLIGSQELVVESCPNLITQISSLRTNSGLFWQRAPSYLNPFRSYRKKNLTILPSGEMLTWRLRHHRMPHQVTRTRVNNNGTISANAKSTKTDCNNSEN